VCVLGERSLMANLWVCVSVSVSLSLSLSLTLCLR